MEVYFNKKSDREISSTILELITKLNDKNITEDKKKIYQAKLNTLKWVVGKNET